VATQARQLKNGVDIFVGTCGRVKDHIERENIDFSDMKTLVLDEADVMLKMGFKEDIEEIMGKATEVCSKDDLQTLLFSATLPDWINEVAREFMKDDITVVDLAQDLTNKTSSKINHLALECAWYQKNEVINKLLNIYASETGKVIIFTATKKDANELGYGDTVEMYNEVMHGDIS
jgi:superfamily II DNA/RNA helicase